jgi:hypothetical protein
MAHCKRPALPFTERIAFSLGEVAAMLGMSVATDRECAPHKAKPLTAWSREMMAEFLITAMPLIRKAMVARDISGKGVTRQSSASMIARETNADGGGPLMTPDEFNDDVPM